MTLLFGTDWETVESGITDDITSVVYNGKTFIALSQKGTIESSDGSHWKASQQSTVIHNDTLYFKNKYIKGVGYVSSNNKDFVRVAQNVDNFDYLRAKIYKFNNFLLAGTQEGNILYSPDGILWNIIYSDFNFKINSIVKFKNVYYVFAENGIILYGTKKYSTPAFSDITFNAGFAYSEAYSPLLRQPIFMNKVMFLSADTISDMIKCNYQYDKTKKSTTLSIGKSKVVLTANSSFVYINGKKTSISDKAVISGNVLFVPAKFALNSLGYSFCYNDLIRRIYVKEDEKAKD